MPSAKVWIRVWLKGLCSKRLQADQLEPAAAEAELVIAAELVIIFALLLVEAPVAVGLARARAERDLVDVDRDNRPKAALTLRIEPSPKLRRSVPLSRGCSPSTYSTSSRTVEDRAGRRGDDLRPGIAVAEAVVAEAQR